MKHQSVIIKTIKKEALLISTFKKLGLEVKEGSCFDLSYFSEVSALVGIPKESVLKKHKINSDKFIDDYVAMIYGEKPVEETLNSWIDLLKDKTVEYNSQKHKSLLKQFVEKETKLWSGAKNFGPNSVLEPLVADWDLAEALFEDASEEFHQKIFSVVEKKGNYKDLF